MKPEGAIVRDGVLGERGDIHGGETDSAARILLDGVARREQCAVLRFDTAGCIRLDEEVLYNQVCTFCIYALG